MANYIKICCVILALFNFQRHTYAGYCGSEDYSCWKTCTRTVKTYDTCWIILECTEYKTETYDCQGTCSRQTCCSGYTGSSCTTDINECSSWNSCAHTCVNTYGSYSCSCNTGYTLQWNGYSCQDRDECLGWTSCDHSCVNTYGSYRCSCYDGYRLLPDGYSCTDVNECSEGTSGCDHSCTNTVGSFSCSCNTGYELSYNGRSCQDINECSRGTSGCQHSCINKVGSFVCSCYTGYAPDLDGKSCADIDECVDGSALCERYCENSDGSYTCTCDTGFLLTANGLGCEDIDECSTGNIGCQQTCVNQPGSYHCGCMKGYELNSDGVTCLDVDECEQGTSGCSQNCDNTLGSYTCTCGIGYELGSDQRTCSDIDDCSGVACQHGGSCKDELNKYSCICSPGFTSAHCETDINECLSYNGGCQDVCTNTVGSFECGCYDGLELQADGYSCPRDGEDGTVFERYQIGGALLPDACFTLSITQCAHGADNSMQFRSTSEWYRHIEQPSLLFTFGITFLENGVITVPISLQGVAITLQDGDCSFSYSVSFITANGNVVPSENQLQDCKVYDLTDSDIFDFISYGSFMKTYLFSLSSTLPKWISIAPNTDSVLSIQNLKSDIFYGHEIKETSWCNEAPVLDDLIYNVFRFDTDITLSILGEEIKIPVPPKGELFCIIVGVENRNVKSFFLMLPDESKSILEGISIFKNLKDKFGLRLLPRGFGLSVVNSQSRELELWNGDTMFSSNLDVLADADVWLGGDIVIDGNLLSIDGGNVDIYFDVPNIETALTSIYLEEWNAYAYAVISPSLRFRLFGKDFDISLSKYNAEAETYASIGGENRSSCGETSNPPGIYFTLQLERSSPFQDVPILKEWHSSVGQKAYGFSTYESFPELILTNTKDSFLELEQSIDVIIDLMSVDFEQVKIGLNFRNTTLIIVEDILQTSLSLKGIFNTILAEIDSSPIDQLKPMIDQVWEHSSETKADISLFIHDTEFIEQGSFINFRNILTNESDVFISKASNILKDISSSLIRNAASFTGFGLKFPVNLVVMTMPLGEFDLEIVYSSESLLQCSRFDKVKEHLKGEKALRVLGRARVQTKLNIFFSYEKGIGLGAAFAIESNNFVFQLQLFVKLLGMKATGDLFITNNGLYLYIEGNVWDIFLAQLDISAEIGKNWYDLVIRVQGRFVAKARKKRNIQTVSTSFEHSYLDGLKKVISSIADSAQTRLDQAKNGLTEAQNQFTSAQLWLEDKQMKLSNANAAFDSAVAFLQTAKDKLEAAKKPFQEALRKLEKAQKHIDNLCTIKTCNTICVPGIECEIRYKRIWFVNVPYSYCWLSDCMISLPDPICVIANVACQVVRGAAYIALEAAKFFVRLPMLAFDLAKAAVSVAQVIVDKSRIVVDIASTLIDLAQTGLEFAKSVLDAAKLVLDGVKFALGAAVDVLNFVIDFGIKSIIDVRNCGFDVEISTKDLPVFAVFCEVNAFKLGWTSVTIKVNFKNIFQSIWNAARATVDMFMKQIGNALGIGRKRREVAFRTTARIHANLLRKIRDVGYEETFSNESIDITSDIFGMGTDIDEDYDSRVLLFNEKCKEITVIMNFMQDTFESLHNIVNESMISINQINSMIDDLQQYSTSGVDGNTTMESLGISKEYAANDYNMTEEDFIKLMENITEAVDSDPLILEINSAANFSVGNLADMKESIESINFLDSWLMAMSNASAEYFNAIECFEFKDCVFYAISSMYDLYEAEDVPDVENIRSSILDLENILIELFQNETHVISDISLALNDVASNLTYLNDSNLFCSLAPTFLSDLKSQIVLNSTSVVFTCNATGDPFPNFWWLKNDAFLPDEHQINLTISSAKAMDSGTYACVAGNVVANITSNEVHLQIVMYVSDNSGEDEIEKQIQITQIALFASGALVAVIAAVVAIKFVYSKKSKEKVLPSTAHTDVTPYVHTKKNTIHVVPLAEAEQRSFGPIKTSFNKHLFTNEIVQMK